MKKAKALLLALCLALCLTSPALAEGVLAEAPLDAAPPVYAAPAPQEATAVLEASRSAADAVQAGDWSALTGAIAAAASEDPDAPTVIEVTGDITLTGMITPPAGKCVKLTSGAGGPYTLTMEPSFSDKRGFSVTGGGTLILENLVLDGNRVDKPIVDVRAGHLVINEGAVLQNSKKCAVQFQVDNTANAKPAASVVMKGGEIKNNAGGGIDMNISMMSGTVQQELSLAVNGGKITGNGTESGSCGGIYARKLSTVSKATAKVTIAGGEISGNKAQVGGGIFVDCPFEMTDGRITGNAASLRGGGIYICENQEPSITGGTIADNTAAGVANSPEKGKGENICTRSDLKLGGGVDITDGVFLYGYDTSGEGHAVLLLDGELQKPLAIEGTYRINPKPMVNMPVAKGANGQAVSGATFKKLSLAGMNQFGLALDEGGVVRLGNVASGQPLIFYSTYVGTQKFGGTAPSQSGTGWAWNKSANTLTLSGAQVSTADSYALCLPPDAKIVLQEGTTSTFTKTGNYYAVFAHGALEITGKGKLVVNGSVVGISAQGPITLNGCEVDATGTANGGIYGYADVTITGCTLNAAGGIVIENGGKLSISDTDAVIDGADAPAVMVMMAADTAPGDYIALADLPNDMQLTQAQEGGADYATVADAEGNTVTALTLQKPAPIDPSAPTAPPVPDTGLALDKTALTLAPGETAKLKVTLTPDDATYKYIFWSADKTDVVTVTDSGLVTAVAEGTATVTAKSWYGNEAICTVTVKKADAPTPPDEPDKPERWPTEGLEGFVTRCYRVALSREPDKAGYEDWVKWLQNGTVDAKSCAHGFVFSKEMNNKHLSDEDFVKTLYRLFMDREGEADGVAFWVAYLGDGHSREDVFHGFADSAEFDRIKAKYGIQ